MATPCSASEACNALHPPVYYAYLTMYAGDDKEYQPRYLRTSMPCSLSLECTHNHKMAQFRTTAANEIDEGK